MDTKTIKRMRKSIVIGFDNQSKEVVTKTDLSGITLEEYDKLSQDIIDFADMIKMYGLKTTITALKKNSNVIHSTTSEDFFRR